MNRVEHVARTGTHQRKPCLQRLHPAIRTGSEATSTSGVAQDRTVALEGELALLRQKYDALHRELGEAAQVQRRLLAPRYIRRGRFEIASEVFPIRHVSGDLLAVFDLDGRTVFAIGDISGKGLFAGMWFTHLMTLIRTSADSCLDPAVLAAAINRHLAALQPEPIMSTLFIGCLDVQQGELSYCNAGHPAPLWLRRDGTLEWLETGGPLLGAVPQAPFENGHIRLQPGDTLIAYSDGVVECRSSNGNDFGAAELVAAARAAAAPSAVATLFSVLAATQDFAATQPHADDVAMLVIRGNQEPEMEARL